MTAGQRLGFGVVVPDPQTPTPDGGTNSYHSSWPSRQQG